MRIGHSPRRRGLLAAGATLAVGAVVAGVSVAGAAQDVTVYIAEANGPCFTTVAAKGTCATGERADVTIQTGESVTWDFAGTSEGNLHNAKATNDVPADPNWKTYASPYFTPKVSRTFNSPGVYTFVCGVHSQMVGSITVEGDPVATPSATASSTATATATATATPTPARTASPTPTATPDDHTSTPAPGHASAKDTEAPRLASASARKQRSGVRVRFWLSEPATVNITLRRKGSRTVLSSATVQSPAGTHALTLRSKAPRKGTYTVALRPTDAMGNHAAAVTTTLRVK